MVATPCRAMGCCEQGRVRAPATHVRHPTIYIMRYCIHLIFGAGTPNFSPGAEAPSPFVCATACMRKAPCLGRETASKRIRRLETRLYCVTALLRAGPSTIEHCQFLVYLIQPGEVPINHLMVLDPHFSRTTRMSHVVT